jgi:hypothetical protein
MNYRGFPNWPPRWYARGDGMAPPVDGEVGILTEVVPHYSSLPHQSAELFLFMEHNGHRYIAAVFFSDPTFCRQVGELLQKSYGRTLEEIGGLDVSGLL